MLNYVKLRKGEVWSPQARSTTPKKVVAGEAWVTYAGCLKDFIVTAGEEFPAEDEALLIESLSGELTIEML